MLDKIKQVMEIKKQAERMKRELEASWIDVQDVSGIKIRINGAQQFQSNEVEERFLNPDNKKKLEADLLKSLNAATAKSQMLAAQKMKDLTGFNIPGF